MSIPLLSSFHLALLEDGKAGWVYLGYSPDSDEGGQSIRDLGTGHNRRC